MDFVLLVIGGIFGGIVNAIAGGGILVTFPLMLAQGLSPLQANTSSSVGIWPGALTSAYGYRSHLKKLRRKFYVLLFPALLGGLMGAIALQKTGSNSFKALAPWFVLLAVLLLTFQPYLHRFATLQAKLNERRRGKIALFTATFLALLGLSVYGGYFGAGFGIVVLATLGLSGMKDIRQMNGMKNLTAASVNLTANLFFIFNGMVVWRAALPMLVGTSIGGWIGATYASKLPAKAARILVIAIGIIVTIILFSRI